MSGEKVRGRPWAVVKFGVCSAEDCDELADAALPLVTASGPLFYFLCEDHVADLPFDLQSAAMALTSTCDWTTDGVTRCGATASHIVCINDEAEPGRPAFGVSNFCDRHAAEAEEAASA